MSIALPKVFDRRTLLQRQRDGVKSLEQHVARFGVEFKRVLAIVGTHDGVRFIVSELLQGETLPAVDALLDA